MESYKAKFELGDCTGPAKAGRVVLYTGPFKGGGNGEDYLLQGCMSARDFKSLQTPLKCSDCPLINGQERRISVNLK